MHHVSYIARSVIGLAAGAAWLTAYLVAILGIMVFAITCEALAADAGDDSIDFSTRQNSASSQC